MVAMFISLANSDISPLMQVRLLYIQEREVQRLAATRLLVVDVRLIAATHRDLAEEVSAGRFRQDLYYRLNVVTIEMPACCASAGKIFRC